MLQKKERLNRNDFNRFFSSGKRIHKAAFQLIYTPYPTLHASVVVPKKVAASAVVRNKIRRRIYDIVRRSKEQMNLHGVFIFIAKEGVIKEPYESLKTEVQKTLKTLI